jgi:hypothetical protein
MTTTAGAAYSPLLDAVLNLSRFHREHEKFYASAPRERGVVLQRHARTLHALADRWSTATPSTEAPLSPYAGSDDLNDPAALQLEGVLFMEGEGTPAELASLIRDLRATAEDYAGTGDWLANAMQASWDIAAALVDIPGLEDLLGDRHRIIANDWLAANTSALIAKQLVRAADILDKIDYTPAALRADLAGPRRSPSLLHSAAEIINRAADLCSDSAGLVNDNERRWRVFRERVAAIVETTGPHDASTVSATT